MNKVMILLGVVLVTTGLAGSAFAKYSGGESVCEGWTDEHMSSGGWITDLHLCSGVCPPNYVCQAHKIGTWTPTSGPYSGMTFDAAVCACIKTSGEGPAVLIDAQVGGQNPCEKVVGYVQGTTPPLNQWVVCKCEGYCLSGTCQQDSMTEDPNVRRLGKCACQ